MKEFFDEVRKAFGPLSQKQVDGFEIILREMKELSLRHQAYVLATAWHETARTMEPIEEYGKGKGREYGKRDPATGHAYYGRGFVQLTWKTNYKNATERLRASRIIPANMDFVRDPSAVMIPLYAAKILVYGMAEGWFTGKKMSDYDSYVNMRRVVNGTDKAELIAGYAEKFERALRAVPDEPVVIPPKPVEEKPQATNGVGAIILGALLAAAAAIAAYFTNGGN